MSGCHWCIQAQSQKSHMPKVAMVTTTLPIAALSLFSVPVARDEKTAPFPSAPSTRNPIEPVTNEVGKPMVCVVWLSVNSLQEWQLLRSCRELLLYYCERQMQRSDCPIPCTYVYALYVA